MKLKFVFVVSVLSILVFSCTDIDIETLNENEAVEILAVAMQSPESDEAIEIANEVIEEYLAAVKTPVSAVRKVAAMVAMPSVELISKQGEFPEQYVVDFGDGYYMDSKARTIMGKVFFSKSDESGSVRTYRFSEFYMDKINIKSYRTIIRRPEYVLHITANDTITLPNSKVYYRTWERTRTLIGSNGDVTEYWNNSYQYEGSAVGTTAEREKYQMKIQKPLVSVANYIYYVSGVVKITTDGGEQTIDFGNGEKDNIVVITKNGIEKKVELNWE